MDKPFFSKGDRDMCLQPMNMKLESEADERHKGRQKLIARFELPRGSYATMIVKRLTATEPLRKDQPPRESQKSV
jgi:tRNA pseudouridine13 synthase